MDSGRAAVARGETIVGYLLLVAAFAVHAAILLQHPVVGAAENGDFWRVTRPAGIVPLDRLEDVSHKCVSQHYGIAPWRLTDAFSSAALIAAASKPLRLGAPVMDIRQVGATYLVLFAGVFALALWAGVAPLCCALLAWAALDVSYSLYFNSFFVDPAALLGFLGIALGLYSWNAPALDATGPRAQRVALVLAALIAGISKQLYILTPLLVAAVVVAWPRRDWLAHLRGAAGTIVALLIAGGLGIAHFTWGSGPRFPEANRHHAVFHGLVLVADDPQAVLAELDVVPPAMPLSGRNYFKLSEAERSASHDALAGLSHTRLVLAYLRAPRRAARALVAAVGPLRLTTTASDPNFSDRSRPPRQYRGWWQMARLRGEHPILAALLLFAGVAALLGAAVQRTWRGAHAALTFLLLNAALVVVASLLGDGQFGLSRHVTAARYCLDLALALILYGGWSALRRRLDPVRRAA
ncbi:MAG: hypothetical protein ACRERC_19215 [Candidatus Binatia bacterium]